MTTDTNAEPTQGEGAEPMDERDVVAYLRAHPQFFMEHGELLNELTLPHAEDGTVSLVQRQIEQLRRTNAQLQGRIEQLLATAARNENIFRHFSDLYIRVLACECLDELRNLLTEALGERLDLPHVVLHLLPIVDKDDNGACARILRRLRPRPYYFGRLTRGELMQLFDTAKVESVALLQINDDAPGAILAIGSGDPNRFVPEMDSLLLEQLRALLGVLLPRLVANTQPGTSDADIAHQVPIAFDSSRDTDTPA